MGGLSVSRNLQISQTRLQLDCAHPDQIQKFQPAIQNVQIARARVGRCDNKAWLELVIEKARQSARLLVSWQLSG